MVGCLEEAQGVGGQRPIGRFIIVSGGIEGADAGVAGEHHLLVPVADEGDNARLVSRPRVVDVGLRARVVRCPVAGPPDPARTDLTRTLSTMYGGGPWPIRLPIPRLAEQTSGNCGDVNTFVGDPHSEPPGYVATITQKLSEHDPQTRDEALELLARLPGLLELVRALDQAGGHDRLSPAETAEDLRRALSNARRRAVIKQSGLG